MRMFLLIYDRTKGELLSLKEFDEPARAEALTERFQVEASKRDKPQIEVVLLSAETLEDLKQTHSRYFESLRSLSMRPAANE